MATITKDVAKNATATTQTKSADLPKIKPEPKSDPLPSLEARLKKLHRLQELAERREIVKGAIDDLSGFYISPDGAGVNLRLQDSKGKTLAISHPSVIGEIVSMCKSKFQGEIEKLENQIDFNLP